MSSEEFNFHTIFAIISGIMLTISEILPFISRIESKGLLHFLVNTGNKFLTKENSQETEPLLPIYHDPSEQREPKEQNNARKSKSKKSKFKERKIHLDTDTEPEHKMLKRKRNERNEIEVKRNEIEGCVKTPEEYELDFLKNYIISHYLDHIIILPSFHLCNRELFEKMGYKIFYDHIDDKYTLKW
jgi:hypothetical protein